MTLFEAIKLTRQPASAQGVCVLPFPPAPKPKAEKPKEPTTGMFVIDAERNCYGWDDEAAVRRDNGAVDYLTGYDIRGLKDAGLWTLAPDTERGRLVINRNKQAKKMWYQGKSKPETAALLGLSESWVDKRGWIFNAALSQEIAENSRSATQKDSK